MRKSRPLSTTMCVFLADSICAHRPSIAFYTKVLGAKPMDGWTGMRLEQDGIQSLSKLQ